MILSRLKEETKQYHSNIESLAYSDRIMSKELTLEEYKKLLVVNYIFNKNLEDRIINSELKNSLKKDNIDIDSRLKTKLIEKDLEKVGVNPEQKFKPLDLKIKDIYDCLGYMYLSEGSTLGGNLISKSLKDNNNLGSLEEFNFYGCYGDKLGENWKTFCLSMNEIVDSEKEEQVIDSAKKAFDDYIDIFKSVIV